MQKDTGSLLMQGVAAWFGYIEKSILRKELILGV